MYTKKTIVTLVVAAVFLLSIAASGLNSSVLAQAPGADQQPVSGVQAIPFNGHLTNEDGQVVADGAFDLTFSLYDASENGSLLWSETQTGVAVKAGNFTTALGKVTALPASIADKKELWIEVSVRGPGEKDFTKLSPRQIVSPDGPTATTALTCPHSHFTDQWTGSTVNLFGLFLNNTGTGDGLRAYTKATASNYGAVYANNTAASGAGRGVYAYSNFGTGVFSSSGSNDGLEATTAATNKSAVYAHAVDSNGVWAFSTNRIGVVASSTNSVALVANSSNTDGIDATTGALLAINKSAVYAHSVNGNGVWGYSTNRIGVHGGSNASYGGDFTATAYRALHSSTSSAIWYSAVIDGGLGLNVTSAGGCTGCTLAYNARNNGSLPIQPGDLVAANGIEVDAATNQPVLLVRLATSSADVVIGVAVRAAAAPSATGPDSPVKAGDGSIAQGDYVNVMISGLAQVKANGLTLNIGDHLVPGAKGAELAADPAASVVRVMSAPDARGLVWVMVSGR